MKLWSKHNRGWGRMARHSPQGANSGAAVKLGAEGPLMFHVKHSVLEKAQIADQYHAEEFVAFVDELILAETEFGFPDRIVSSES
jgi:hypothetical protein